MTKSVLLCLALILQCCALLAQNSEPEAVFLKKSTIFDVKVNNGHWDVTERNLTEKVFYRNFEKHSRESVHYSDLDPVTDLEAVTLTPSGSGFKKTKVSTIETQDMVQPGIFYGGYKRQEFVFPRITPGAIGRLEYTKHLNDIHFLSPFYFGEDIPVQQATLIVTIPHTVSIRHKVFGELANQVVHSEQNEGSQIIHTWTLNQVPAFRKEKDSPAMPYTIPHVVFYVDSYTTSRGTKDRVLSDVTDLYLWYHSLVKQIPRDSDTQLREMVKELIREAQTDEDKARIIFQWVQHNIKYIAFENGMAGFIPRSSADVYTKRYGDCKDMANLLKDMLGMCGIEAYHTWIGTRSKPYTYQDVPTAISDNHMICSIKGPAGYIFLDATNPFLAYGKPSSMIQGKEALIGLSPERCEVVKVPLANRVTNYRNDSLSLEIEKDGVRGTLSSLLDGYRKDDIEIKLMKAQVNNDRESIRDFFTLGNNNIVIEKLSVRGLGDQNKPANVDFAFFQPGYHKYIGDKVYVNMNLNKSTPGERLDESTRKQLYEQDYCYQDRSLTVLQIPEGYAASFVPADTHKSWPQFGVTSTYRAIGNAIVAEKTIYSDFLYLDPSQFRQWNEFLTLVNTINQQSVTLSKK